MKNYLLFAGPTFYPEGGWSDFKKDFESQQEAESMGEYLINDSEGEGFTVDWVEVVDSATGKILFKQGSRLG